MLERGKNERGVIEMVDKERLAPAEHLLLHDFAACLVMNQTGIKSR